jgi:hypothetical protein
MLQRTIGTARGIMYFDKNQIIITGIFLFLALTGSAMAVDLTGKWTVSTEEAELEMVFIQNGTALKGTVYNPKFGEAEIKNGIIDGNNISFYLERVISYMQYINLWQGKAAGNKIQFLGASGEARGTTATRVRSNPPSGASALPVDISGQWTARLQNGVKIGMSFAAKGNTFTGFVDNPREGKAKIKGGTISGTNISFYIIRNESKIQWLGKVAGDEIQFTSIAIGETKRATGKRVNSNLPSAALAAPVDLSGKWVASLQTGVHIELYFKVNGTTLTGTAVNSQVGESEMKDGKIEGDNISFYLIRKAKIRGEADALIQWKGKVVGDEIRFTCFIPGNEPIQVTVDRVRTNLQK